MAFLIGLAGIGKRFVIIMSHPKLNEKPVMWSWLKSAVPEAHKSEPNAQPMRHYTPQAAKQMQGAAAEQLASDYLQKRGLKLIDANVACVQGEIDLVMQDDKTLVFVEVRWRKSTAYGGALTSITPNKLRKLNTACEMFLQHHPQWRNAPCRIDAVLLQGDLAQPEVTWLQNITG